MSYLTVIESRRHSDEGIFGGMKTERLQYQL